MADIVHTATGALGNTAGTYEDVTWGGTVTAGMPVYKHTDSKHYAALNDTALHAAVVGYAMSGGAAGQRGRILTAGILTLSGGLTKAITYYCSVNAGGIAPIADVLSGDFVTILGVASSTTTLKIVSYASGQDLA